MNSLNGFFRKILPRRSASRDECTFELLRCTSARHFKKRSLPGAHIPRFYSQYDEILTESPKANSDEVIEVLGEEGGRGVMKDESVLLGFIDHCGDSFDASPSCSAYGSEFPNDDSLFDKAINECHLIRSHPLFTEGVLLKCIDPQPLFPFLHYGVFTHPDCGKRVANVCETIRGLNVQPKCQYGAYEEVFSIQKSTTAPDFRLPSHRHAGFIVISFKLLDDQTQQESLEKSWLGWTGAREIYKYSPRNWNLKRISLYRLYKAKNASSRAFAYVLMCEFGSIFHPSNRLQALDMCERMKVRKCGYISLYQVHWSYSNVSSSSESDAYVASVSRRERNPMLRGFSQEVETTGSPRRRNPKLRTRDRSLGYTLEEPSTSPISYGYQHFSDLG